VHSDYSLPGHLHLLILRYYQQVFNGGQ